MSLLALLTVSHLAITLHCKPTVRVAESTQRYVIVVFLIIRVMSLLMLWLLMVRTSFRHPDHSMCWFAANWLEGWRWWY